METTARVWLPSGMIMWRTCWCGPWTARGSHLTYTHNRWANIVCLQRPNFTSAHQWVLIEVWLWHYHTSALSPYDKGWWEKRKGKKWLHSGDSRFQACFWEEVLSQQLLANCSLQAVPHRVFVDPSAELSSIQTPLNLFCIACKKLGKSNKNASKVAD